MTTKVWLEPFQQSLVVRKSFGSGAEAANRHRTSTQWLLTARNHSVVRVQDVDVEQLITTTDLAGPATLVSADRSPGEAAHLLASVASTLGDLHADGLVHGNLLGPHILIDRSGPVLCSPWGVATDPSTDIIAMTRIIDHLVERWRTAGAKQQQLQPWTEIAEQVGAEATFSARRLHRLVSDAGRPRSRWSGLARPSRPSRPQKGERRARFTGLVRPG